MRQRVPPRFAQGTVVLASVTLAGALLAAAQHKKVHDEPPPQAATAFVLGRVVDASTNRAVPRATVTLVAEGAAGDSSPALQSAPGVLTDAAGRFLFRGLAAGRYRFTVTAPRYLEGAAGQRRPGGPAQPIVVDTVQAIPDLTIRLWPEATIAGVVLDEAGDPVPEVSVSLLRRETDRPGGPVVRHVSNARTDDRGAYLLSGIEPGTYYVGVATRTVQAPAPRSPAIRIGQAVIQTSGDGMWSGSNVLAGRLPITVRADGRVVGYVSTFHPASTALGTATALRLAAGDEVTGIDIQLRPQVMSRVAGTVIGPTGPEPGIDVALIPSFAVGQTMERTHGTLSTTSDGNGGFAFVAVPAGSYRLRAWRRPQILVIGREALPPDATLWSDAPIDVGDDAVEGLAVTVQPGATLSGRIRFEGAAAQPNPVQLQTPISVAFEPPWFLAFGSRLAARVSAAFEFITQGLPPGRYFANLPNNFTSSVRGWHFESARHEGRDLTRTPIVLEGRPITDLEITFSDRRSDLFGTVADAAGRPSSDASVVIMPADYRAWIRDGLPPLATQVEAVTQRGEYTIQLRPGDYLVAVVADEALAVWPDAATVEAIAPRATPVTISRGERRRLDLRRQ